MCVCKLWICYLSRFWITCLCPLVLLLPKLKYLSVQSFDFERTWCRLFQKRVVCTKVDIYVVFFTEELTCHGQLWGTASSPPTMYEDIDLDFGVLAGFPHPVFLVLGLPYLRKYIKILTITFIYWIWFRILYLLFPSHLIDFQGGNKYIYRPWISFAFIMHVSWETIVYDGELHLLRKWCICITDLSEVIELWLSVLMVRERCVSLPPTIKNRKITELWRSVLFVTKTGASASPSSSSRWHTFSYTVASSMPANE